MTNASHNAQMDANAAALSELTISFGFNNLDTSIPRTTDLESAFQKIKLNDRVPVSVRETAGPFRRRENKESPREKRVRILLSFLI
jgi:hypothetical protein